MFAPLLLAILGSAQAGPAFSPLSSGMFQESVRAVETSLEAHDYVKAKALLEMLPKRQVSVIWNDKKVPEANRAEFREAFDKAVSAWPGLKVVTNVRSGDVIEIGAEPKLAVDSRSGIPANVVTFFSNTPVGNSNKIGSFEPRLDARIALQRGRDGRAATAKDITNDVRFIIGSYLGLARHNLPAFTMFPDSETDDIRLVGRPEVRAVNGNLELADLLRKAVTAKTPVGITGVPKATIGPSSFEGKATQGEQIDLPIEVKNTGTGTVVMDVQGDCGCIVPESAPPVPAGKTGAISVRLDTSEYGKPIERNVVVYTNDPEAPTVIIPVRVNIIPRYRFIAPEGTTFTIDEGGRSMDLYLVFPDNQDMKASHVRLIGIEGAKATFEPWKGSLADAERSEEPRDRHGYKIHLVIPSKLPTARSLLNVNVLTDTPGFTSLYQDIYAQKGIVAFPGELFFGELATTAKTATILLNRPGKPFKITSLQASANYFAATVEPSGKPDEYKVVLKYNGKGKSGDVQDKLTINTDDPKQPTITVPITGSIR